jgi:hypothetical protein
VLPAAAPYSPTAANTQPIGSEKEGITENLQNQILMKPVSIVKLSGKKAGWLGRRSDLLIWLGNG